MQPCVYTTQFPVWLRAAAGVPAGLACFRSNKRWSKAAKLLDQYGTVPILFRIQEDSDTELACQYVAELVEIHFRKRFDDDEARLAWLDDKLKLQRDTIKQMDRTEEFPTWESQFQVWEIANFMEAKTWYIVRNLHEIKPLPLSQLRKLKDDQPLASNYKRGYALCHFPEDKIAIPGG